MAVFRINKTKNYTVMSNYHLKDKNLSLKSKGLLSVMLSLPEDWDYSVRGLEKICKESKDTINNILQELEKYNYLKRIRVYCNGKISEWEYNIYEEPLVTVENTEVDLYPKNQDIENQDIENKDVNKITKQLKTKQQNKYKRYGEYQNVFFTDEQYNKLLEEFPNDYEKRIQALDYYIQSKGKKYKDCLATIRVWARKEGYKKPEPKKQYKECVLTEEEYFKRLRSKKDV